MIGSTDRKSESAGDEIVKVVEGRDEKKRGRLSREINKISFG
jgi:hypothetical protein